MCMILKQLYYIYLEWITKGLPLNTKGEKIIPIWINTPDIETDLMEEQEITNKKKTNRKL